MFYVVNTLSISILYPHSISFVSIFFILAETSKTKLMKHNSKKGQPLSHKTTHWDSTVLMLSKEEILQI